MSKTLFFIVFSGLSIVISAQSNISKAEELLRKSQSHLQKNGVCVERKTVIADLGGDIETHKQVSYNQRNTFCNVMPTATMVVNETYLVIVDRGNKTIVLQNAPAKQSKAISTSKTDSLYGLLNEMNNAQYRVSITKLDNGSQIDIQYKSKYSLINKSAYVFDELSRLKHVNHLYNSALSEGQHGPRAVDEYYSYIKPSKAIKAACRSQQYVDIKGDMISIDSDYSNYKVRNFSSYQYEISK